MSKPALADIENASSLDFLIQNIEDLLGRLLTTSSRLGEWIYDIPKAKKEIISY